MQVKQFVAALAAAIPALAFAQEASSVAFYGIVDLAVAREDQRAPGTASKKAIHAGRDANRFGFRGSEDLGQGIKAIFNLEGGFDASTGKGDAELFGRRAVVGLEGGFGQLSIGREYTPIDTISSATTTMGQGFYGSNLNAFSQGKMTRRVSNSVNYKTPTFGGFKLSVAAAPGEAAGLNDYIGLGADFKAGPLFVGMAAASIERANGDDKEYIMGAAYKVGNVEFKGNYMIGDQVGVRNKFEQGNLGASFAFGPSTVYANVQQSRFGNGAKGNGFALTYAYSLSKRTFAYASWATTNNNQLANFSVASAGSAVTPPATAPGSDPRAFAIGIRHAF